MDGKRVGGWEVGSSSDDEDEGLACVHTVTKTDLRKKLHENDFGPDWPIEILQQLEKSNFGGGSSFYCQLNAMNAKIDGFRNDFNLAFARSNASNQATNMNQVSEYSFNDTLY